MSAIIVHPSLKHAFKSITSLTYHIVLLPTVGKGRGCLLYHIVSLQVNRICLDFLHIVLTWRLGSEPLTGAAQMERGAPLYQTAAFMWCHYWKTSRLNIHRNSLTKLKKRVHSHAQVVNWQALLQCHVTKPLMIFHDGRFTPTFDCCWTMRFNILQSHVGLKSEFEAAVCVLKTFKKWRSCSYLMIWSTSRWWMTVQLTASCDWIFKKPLNRITNGLLTEMFNINISFA